MRTKIVEEWHVGIRLSHMAHSMAAAENTRMHRFLGIPVVITSTVVGTTVFATLGQQPQIAISIVVGLLSVAAAILSSLQTFLSYSASAERHKIASVKYGMLRRELEQFINDPDESRLVLKEFMENFRTRWDQLDHESPPLNEATHNRAYLQLQKRIEQRRTEDMPPNNALKPTGSPPLRSGDPAA